MEPSPPQRTPEQARLIAELQAIGRKDKAELRTRLQQLGVATLGARLQVTQRLLAA